MSSISYITLKWNTDNKHANITLRKSPPAVLSPSDHIAFPAECRGYRSPWQQTGPEFYSTAPMMPQEQIEPQHTKSSDRPGQTTDRRQVNALFDRLHTVYWVIIQAEVRDWQRKHEINTSEIIALMQENVDLSSKLYWSLIKKFQLVHSYSE